MRHKQVKKQQKPAQVFQSEVMNCAGCARFLRANPHVESHWTFIEDSDGRGFYLCPQCFSNWMTDAVRWAE